MKNEHVLVLGGSSGIGRAVAAAAVASGARVTLAARETQRLSSAATAIGAAGTVTLDIAAADADALDRLAASGPFDHVYVAAGQFVGGEFATASPDALQMALGARLVGAAHVLRQLLPHLADTASIVLTGGLSTARPVRGAWATAVGTAAAEQLARALALELAPRRVNAVSPGWTDTPLWDAVLGAGKHETFDSIARQLPVRRLATPNDVAEAVLFLMRNRSMTGEVLHVDGGHRLI